MKQLYTMAVRAVRPALSSTGILRRLEQSKLPHALWLRSLVSIYDCNDLIHLDLPWWTFPAIEAVEDDLLHYHGGARVFEYGSGASTVWLAKRCAHVTTVEHDLSFADAMSPTLAGFANVEAMTAPPDTGPKPGKARSNRHGYRDATFDGYVGTIDKTQGQFDVIVIDGRSRVACLERAKQRLNPAGLILFDNSDRAEYRPAIESSGLEETRYRGLAPALPFKSQTSVLRYRA